jgi:hypothetical protein
MTAFAVLLCLAWVAFVWVLHQLAQAAAESVAQGPWPQWWMRQQHADQRAAEAHAQIVVARLQARRLPRGAVMGQVAA